MNYLLRSAFPGAKKTDVVPKMVPNHKLLWTSAVKDWQKEMAPIDDQNRRNSRPLRKINND